MEFVYAENATLIFIKNLKITPQKNSFYNMLIRTEGYPKGSQGQSIGGEKI